MTCEKHAISAEFRKTRRAILKSAPLLMLSPQLFAQNTPTAIAVLKLHSFHMRVSDVGRSVEFYQGLFGAAIQSRHGDTVILRLGAGPYFFSLSPARAGEVVGIFRIGISVPNFSVDAVQGQLLAHGIERGAQPASGQPALAVAMRSWIHERGPDAGGSADGTRDLFFADQDGLVYQLSDPSYCGGSGLLGGNCGSLQESATTGKLKLVELSHFTNRVYNSAISNQFIRNLFGLNFQTSQGPGAPVIGVGDGKQFLMYIGGAGEGRPANAGVIDHVSIGVENFTVDGILNTLTEYGLSPRQSATETPPLVHYVTLRMPNRNGAEGGTPELYFSDPDGIRIQLQDPGYCGGNGYLGDDCSA